MSHTRSSGFIAQENEKHLNSSRVQDSLRPPLQLQHPEAESTLWCWLHRALARQYLKRALTALADLLAVLGAFCLTFWMASNFLELGDQLAVQVQNLYLILPLILFATALLNGYKTVDYLRPETELEIVLKSVTLAFLLIFATNFLVFKTVIFSRYFILGWYGLALVAVPLGRASLRGGFHLFWKQGWAQQRALLVGSASQAARLQSTLIVQRHLCFRLVGYLSPDGAGEEENVPGVPHLGDLRDWDRMITTLQPNELLVALDDYSQTTHETILAMTRRCQELRLPIVLASDLFNVSNGHCELDEFSGFFVFGQRENSVSISAQRLIKRAMDVGFGLVGCGLTLVMLPFVSLAVKLEDGGPVFFRQEYLGANGRKRHYWKFRTMKVGAAKMLEEDPHFRKRFEENFKLTDDPRVTRVGRFLRKYSLDEFPEFFDVLTGDLSFVGPRTISASEAIRYGRYLDKLLSVKPGLTGFWQVMGRQSTNYDERIRMDMFYIERWSVWLDIVITLKTVYKVVLAEGAY